MTGRPLCIAFQIVRRIRTPIGAQMYDFVLNADGEVKSMEKQRADRRACKRRKQMSLLQTRLQTDGTTSTVVFTTRPLNKRISFTYISDSLRSTVPGLYTTLLAAMDLQASGLETRKASPAAAVQIQAVPSAAEPPAPASLPQPAQPGISRRQLSSQAAAEDIVNRWKGFRLRASASREELKRFLQDRQQRPNCTSKDALLARVEAILRQEHPDGEAMLYTRWVYAILLAIMIPMEVSKDG